METKDSWLSGPMTDEGYQILRERNEARQALALAQLKKSGKSLLCCRQCRLTPMPPDSPPLGTTYWRAS